MVRRSPHTPVGILHATPVPNDARFERYLPADARLGEFVEHYWSIRWNLPEPVLRTTLPHPSFHVVVEPQTALVYGVGSRVFKRTLEGNSWVFGIKFRPGMFRPLLNNAASAFKDRNVPLQSIVGSAGEDYAHEICTRQNDEERVGAAEAFLASVLPQPDERCVLARRISEIVRSDREIVAVEQIGERFGINTRTLQRLFRDAVGVHPKWLIKRYRLHDAVETIKAGGAIDWTQLALRLGYFDQAHFIRDFRSLVGRTPAEFHRTVR